MASATRQASPPPVPRVPAPLPRGPPGLLRVLRAHRGWLTLRWRRRLQTDGLCFVGPGVKLEIGRGAVLRLGRWSWLGHGTKIRVHEGEGGIGAKTGFGQEGTISAFQPVS